MRIAPLLILHALFACSETKSSHSAGPSGDAGDADTGTDADTDTDVEDVTTHQTFCAGGGVVSNDNYSGTTCTAPLEIATRNASNDSFTWQPGPTVFIAPRGGLE